MFVCFVQLTVDIIIIRPEHSALDIDIINYGLPLQEWYLGDDIHVRGPLYVRNLLPDLKIHTQLHPYW